MSLALGTAAQAFGPIPYVGFPLHLGALVALQDEPGLQAVVRLTVQKGDIEAAICTGTFISRSLVLTAAHCLDGARRVYLETPQTGGVFYQPDDSNEFYVSREEMDVALVRFSADAFSGRPLDYRIMDSRLLDRIREPGWAFRTFGFGRNETGNTDDRMRSDWVQGLDLSAGLFTSRDRFRLDQGDSGGPIFAVSQQGTPGAPGPAWIVGVNHAYNPETPTEQFYQPLHSAFFEDLLGQGVDIPTVTCSCRGLSRTEERRQPYGYLQPCSAFEDPTTGTSCVVLGTPPALAQPLRGQSPPAPTPTPPSPASLTAVR